ncbi:glycoside hydrolase family 3 N-terminal domain-containing protein, partial [Bifidobacterium sp. SO4]|uniref:glycoside hydrolase family 3 N-terminal domain-containing protein n=1 Tax=Bifidobacterium sp. SO4 TaxID=2809030 RepID=UPI0023E7AA9C
MLHHLGRRHRRGEIQLHRTLSFLKTEHTKIFPFGLQENVRSPEQAIREIYLRPFEECVKYGKATAVMNSMNFIGDMYAGAHEGLLTEVLRNEWGFRGKVLTDMDEGGASAGVNAALRAGCDAWLGGTHVVRAKTDADIYYLQRAAHNSLYTYASGTLVGITPVNWRGYIAGLTVEWMLLVAISLFAIVQRTRKPRNVAAKEVTTVQ